MTTWAAHLKEVCQGQPLILLRLCDGAPHAPQVSLPGLLEPLHWCLGAVTEDKQQHRLALVGSWGEQLQVDLQRKSEDTPLEPHQHVCA